jgi:ERCC4-type nuclease
LTDFGISVIHTRNPADTARLIYWIARREQVEGGQKIGVKVRPKPKDVRKLQEQIVAGLPGVSSVLSRRLLAHFATIERVFSADVGELRRVRGIGRQLARRIRAILTREYEV